MSKKLFGLFLMVVALFSIASCTNDDTAKALEAALDGITVSAEVTENLTLPTSGEGGIVISWSSDKTDVIANDGTVTRPSADEGNATVKLTATLTLNDETLAHTFTVIVLAEEELDPMESLTEGYFVFSFYAEGYGSYTSFFHFYEEDPVLGAVFYYGGSNNRQNAAGTYTIEEKDIEWTAFSDRAHKVAPDSVPNTGTAPYTITFYDFEGNKLDEAGYDGTYLYNDMENTAVASSGANEVYYIHDMDEASEYNTTYEAEVGIPYVELINPDDETATLNINHNGTYTDLVNEFIVEGTWAVENGTAGALEFTLTPTESYDKGALVVLSADGLSATYKQDGSSTEVNLEVPVEVVVPDDRVLLFQFDVAQTDRTLSLYEDGTYEFNYVNGTVVEIGTFTYTGYTLTLIQENDNEIVATMDSTSHALSLNYVSIAGEGAITATFTVESSVWGVAFGSDGEFEPVIPQVVLFAWTSTEENKTLTLFTDGTYTFEYSAYSIVEVGTFTYTGYTLTITQSNDNEIVATMDSTSYTLSLNYVTVAGGGAISATFTAASSVWGAAFGSDGEWVPEGTPVIIFSWTGSGSSYTLDFYNDGTYVFQFSTYSLVEEGTFTFTSWSLKLTQSNDNILTATMDSTTKAYSFEYVAVVNAALKTTFTVESSVWGPVFGSDGSYTPGEAPTA